MLSICAFNFYFQIYMYLHILPANICSPYHLHQVRNLLPANDKKFTTSFSLGKRGGKEMSIQVRTFSVPYSFTSSRLLQKMTKLNAQSLRCVGHITIGVFQVKKKERKRKLTHPPLSQTKDVLVIQMMSQNSLMFLYLYWSYQMTFLVLLSQMWLASIQS